MTKTPAGLDEGRARHPGAPNVTRPQSSPPRLETCAHCHTTVCRAALFVNDPNGPSGWFHLDCYPAARMGAVSVEARLLHADAESCLGAEHRMWELIRPRTEDWFRRPTEVGHATTRSPDCGETVS